MNVIIIDDEALARQRIRKLLSERPEVEIVAECGNGQDAIAAIMEHQPDLIFLDIQMKDSTGFDVLQAIPQDQWPLTIFVTAYNQYAIQAFDIFAFDYLLKPFKNDRFYQSLDKAMVQLGKDRKTEHLEQLEQLIHHLRKGTEKPLSLKQGSKISLVQKDEIRYIEASGYYIEVYTSESKRLLLRESMTKMLEQLDAHNFLRIHRSTIINTDYLAEVQHTGAGDVVTKMKDGKTFRVSKSYKEELFRRLEI